jgi:hypothetical protein
MTLNDWNKRQDFKTSWKTFYKSEVGQALKQVVMTLGTPVPTMPPQGVDFIDWNATINSRREGYFEVLRVLDLLSEESSETTDLPAPWEKSQEETIETTQP